MFLKGIVLHRDTEIPEMDEFRWIFVQSYHLVSFHDMTSDLATKKSSYRIFHFAAFQVDEQRFQKIAHLAIIPDAEPRWM